MLIAIDHGSKLIKTVNCPPFTSGLVGSDVLQYQGKYYQLSDQRIPYRRDKTGDDRFFVLTLFAIATEPIIRQQAPPPDDLQAVLAMNGEISGGEITIRDIQEMFLEEYGLRLRSTERLYVGIAGNRLTESEKPGRSEDCESISENNERELRGSSSPSLMVVMRRFGYLQRADAEETYPVSEPEPRWA